MTIANPKILYILLATITIYTALYFKIRPLDKRNKFTYHLRSAVVFLVILSLLGINIEINTKNTGTVFLIDQSVSVEKYQDELHDFVKKSFKKLNKDNYSAIMNFAKDTIIEENFTNKPKFDFVFAKNDKTESDIAKAIENASLIFPKDYQKRIVLMSDLRQTTGDLKSKLINLKNNNFSVDLYPIEKTNDPEVQMQKLELPSTAKDSENIQAKLTIKSNTNSDAEIYFYCKDKLLSKKTVKLKKGENKNIFSTKISGKGLVNYKAEVVCKDDTVNENNTFESFVNVTNKPRVLVIKNYNNTSNLTNLLSEIDIKVMPKSSVPTSIVSLLQYDAFILEDVNLDNLDKKFIDNLEILVKEHGKGLLAIGGQNSFGMGGYHKSKLEKMLPVNAKVKDKKKKNDVAMLLIIDRSGSMSLDTYGVTNQELSIEAAIKSVEVLNNKDEFGVIAFDMNPICISKLKTLTNKTNVINEIKSIHPDGGTSILPALSLGVRTLSKSTKNIKHIILLTDGEAEKEGYNQYIEEAKNNKITISTVAIGESADHALMKRIAKKSEGRYYRCDVFTDLPKIFAKETMLAGKKYLNKLDFYPKLVNQSKILNSIDELAKLNGYIATSEKKLANVVLEAPDESPILATYNYGLGKTIALTTDIDGLWSKDWLVWDKTSTMFNNMISFMLSRNIGSDYTISSKKIDGKTEIKIEFKDIKKTSSENLTAHITDKDGKTQIVKLKMKKPAVYTGLFENKSLGFHSVRVSDKKDDKIENYLGGIVIPYPKEFDVLSNDTITPEEFIKISNGRILKNPEEVFTGKVYKQESNYDLSKLLMILAFILFLIELTYRMTNIKIPSLKFKTDKLKNVKNNKHLKISKNTNKNKKLTKKQKNKLEEEKTANYLDGLLK